MTMKKFITLSIIAGLFFTNACQAQPDKSKRPSPPAIVSQTINTGTTVSVDYSQPSIKGRTIGKDIEPMDGKVWRMGANEATVFEADKDVTINGEKLPAGKYSLFGLVDGSNITLMFNTEWKTWGTNYEKNKEKDVLKVTVPVKTNDKLQEQLSYSIDKKGNVELLWGNMIVAFVVQ